MGEVISLLSGTGGMGKSCLTAGVALALAKNGRNVLCVDCQPGLGTLDIYLGMESLDVLSYTDICRGDYPLSRAAAHPETPRLRFLAAPVRLSADEAVEQAFGAMLRRAKAEFDYILLNAPAGLEEMALLAAEHADRCILVSGIDPASIRTASRAADHLQLMGVENIRLVVSRVHPGRLRAMKLNVDDVIDRVGVPLLGLVPEDEQVLLSAAAGSFPAGKKAAFAAYGRIAMRIQGKPVPVSIR